MITEHSLPAGRWECKTEPCGRGQEATGTREWSTSMTPRGDPAPREPLLSWEKGEGNRLKGRRCKVEVQTWGESTESKYSRVSTSTPFSQWLPSDSSNIPLRCHRRYFLEVRVRWSGFDRQGINYTTALPSPVRKPRRLAVFMFASPAWQPPHPLQRRETHSRGLLLASSLALTSSL